MQIDVSRQACPSPHSATNKIGRALWAVAWILFFRPSPQPLWAWRRLLLRCFGARIAVGVKIMPSVRIWAPWNLSVKDHGTLGDQVDCYCVAPVSIGAHATVSQHAHLCAATHDLRHPNMPVVAEPITIGSGAWVCAGAFVRHGITIGEGAVCGARAVVVKDVAPWTVVAGNPAREIKKRALSS